MKRATGAAPNKHAAFHEEIVKAAAKSAGVPPSTASMTDVDATWSTEAEGLICLYVYAPVNAVRTHGGVLEHPASSLAWKRYELQRPLRVGDGWTASLYDAGWVCEVAQSAYGHRARKLTWLYYIGGRIPEPLDWRDPETTAIVSGFTHQAKGEHVACEHRRVRPKEASSTPPAFRDALLSIARTASRAPLEAPLSDREPVR